MEEESSISLGPLRIRIHGRQFPDSRDYWDGNWLFATAHCLGLGSRVEVTGPFLHLSDLQKWGEDLLAFRSKPEGCVELTAIEPNLQIKIRAQQSTLKLLSCEVDITSDNVSEQHHFSFGADQSHVTILIAQLTALSREYPLRGNPNE